MENTGVLRFIIPFVFTTLAGISFWPFRWPIDSHPHDREKINCIAWIGAFFFLIFWLTIQELNLELRCMGIIYTILLLVTWASYRKKHFFSASITGIIASGFFIRIFQLA